ncbi:unnamed protein product, partial [Aphanomyces euteiches]
YSARGQRLVQQQLALPLLVPSFLIFPKSTQNADMPRTASSTKQKEGTGTWTRQEHERFLTGITLYPKGPWKRVAAIVKTRTERQLRTHAQKYRQKLARRQYQLAMRRSVVYSHDIVDDMTKIEPIKFSETTTQDDDCIAFLIDALGDDLRLQ